MAVIYDDTKLQQAVLAELAWEPSVTAAHIGVTAISGVVTLTIASITTRPNGSDQSFGNRSAIALARNLTYPSRRSLPEIPHAPRRAMVQ